MHTGVGMMRPSAPVRRSVVRSAAAPRPFVTAAPRPARRSMPRVMAVAAGAAPTFQSAPAVPVVEKGELTQYPNSPGVYAVYDANKKLQYIGLSRKISASVATHMQELKDLTQFVKFAAMDDASREKLTEVWKAWVEAAVVETGSIPPGNAPGESKWQSRSPKANKPEIRLTAGKGITGITMEQLIDKVVKEVKVVAFVKGTRQQPSCGFSYKMLTTLNDLKIDYEVVNVLDDVHNPGLRDAIKTYSQWPTIPQLFIGGEFVGGADIVEQMLASGELAEALAKVR